MPTSATPLVVRAAWLLIAVAALVWAGYAVASQAFLSPPLPKHATGALVPTRATYGATEPVVMTVTISGDIDLDVSELAVEVIAPSGAVVRVLIPVEGRSAHVSAARALAFEMTWDQRDAANESVPGGRYGLRLRAFFSSSAGAGAAFASASVDLGSR